MTSAEERRKFYREADELLAKAREATDPVTRRRALRESMLAKERGAASLRVNANGYVLPDLPPAA